MRFRKSEARDGNSTLQDAQQVQRPQVDLTPTGSASGTLAAAVQAGTACNDDPLKWVNQVLNDIAGYDLPADQQVCLHLAPAPAATDSNLACQRTSIGTCSACMRA